MIDFYNAFISYKHAKLDTSVAEHIQKKLEHFHVPHKLKKGLRHQKITRIFRDKDELPITSDLTETITDALRKAEFLIVICSTNTKESIWVKREINTFLQTHSRDNILTVLCDGEPNEVIPEEILSTEKEFMDANGYIQKIRVPVEPLSCDYRLSRGRADREELPRLASVILGCSYDELQRRRRQYAIRRAAAIIAVVFAGMAAFGAYMSYSRQQIDKSYVESLRSRSIYLANESQQLLNDNKRTDAVQLALAALPADESDKMPVTADAIRAITDSTAAYKSNSGVNYKPVWNYKTERRIKNIMVSDDGEYLIAEDRNGSVYTWNAITHELIFEKNGNAELQGVIQMDKESLLFIYLERLEAYNISSGKLMWSYEKDGALFTERKIYCALNSVFVDIGEGEVAKLSAKDGSIKETYKPKSDTLLLSSFEFLTVSPDGKKIAYADSSFMMGEDYKLHIYDIESGKDSAGSIDNFYISELQFIDNNHLCVIANDDGYFSSVEYSTDYSYISDGYMSIYCFDNTMQKQWVSQLDYNSVSNGVKSLYLPSRDAVAFSSGNTAIIIDMKTGNTVNRYFTGSTLLTISDWNDNGLPEFISKQGEYIFATSTEDNGMMVYNVLGSNLDFGLVGDFVYVVPDDENNIICYGRRLEDDEWEAVAGFSNNTAGSTYQAFYADEEYIIIAATLENTGEIRISTIDPAKGKLLSTADLSYDGNLTSFYDIYRIDEEFYGVFGTSVYKIDPKNGTAELIELSLSDSDSVSGGMIISPKVEDDTFTVDVTNIGTSDTRTFTLENIEGLTRYSTAKSIYSTALNTVFVPRSGRLFAGNLNSGEFTEITLPDSWTSEERYNLYAVASEDGSRIVLSDGNTIWVTDKDYKEIYTLHGHCDRRFGACFRNGILFIAEEDCLSLYNANNGEFINKYEMTLYGLGLSEFTFVESFQQLFIQTSAQICIFDMNSWTEIASIEDVYCYNEENDRFYVYSFVDDDHTTPGYIKHYTVSELIEKAKRYLNGQELDEDTKRKYGLG